MAGALFSLSLFLITVCGLLLFRPVQINDITDYSKPAALEQRMNVATKMARFLEKNPQILKQERLTALPLSPATSTPEKPEAPPMHKVEISFQGASLQFRSMNEFNQWIYKNVNDDAIGFIKQLNPENNPELYVDTLKKVSEINTREEITSEIKSAYLNAARELIQVKDGFHQQIAAKAIQNYLEMEKDLTLGKKNADEVLNSNNKQY
jgi:hypothetical protein